jgi:hypothetical protein
MQATKSQPMSRLEVLGLVARDIERVEKAIGTESVCSVDAVTAISNHLQKSGGKRPRAPAGASPRTNRRSGLGRWWS